MASSLWRPGLAAAVLAASGCGATEPSPIANLQGTWSLGFSATTGTPCPRDPENVPGCGGVATVQFQPRGDVLAVTSDGFGGCQSCSGAFDFILAGITATSAGSQLTMHVPQCRLTGPLPAATDDTAQGETVCFAGTTGEARGTWRLTRAAR